MLTMHVNPGFLTGRLHHQGGGVVFFSLSVIALWFLICAFQERNPPPVTKLPHLTGTIEQGIGQ